MPEEYTDQDIERAEELASQDKTALLLWLAVLYGINNVGKVFWDAKTLSYRTAGRVVPKPVVITALETVREVARFRALRLAFYLQAGNVSVREWELDFRILIKATHLLSAALVQGGRAQLSPAELARLAALTEKQFAYLSAFTMQVPNLSLDARFLQRVQMYINASRETSQETERRLYENAGYDEEKNLLSPADHCAECVELSERGWQPMGTLPSPGERVCLTNCQCELIFRKAA